MTRTLRMVLTTAVAATLAGCATAPMSSPPMSPPPSSRAPVPATPSRTVSAVPPASATPATASPSAPAAPLKKLASAKLPTQVADRRADTVADSAGGQSASYYLPMSTADVIHAAVSPIGTAADAAGRLRDAKPSGPATCGTITVADKQTGACVVALEGGYLLVNGSGGQPVEVVAAFTSALYGTLP